jgi:hypothetical protein
MDLVIGLLFGWCGTGWPLRFPTVSGGPVIEPGDWPDNCPVCLPVLGALIGMVIIYAMDSYLANAGLMGKAAVAFASGSFGAQLVRGVAGMLSRR